MTFEWCFRWKVAKTTDINQRKWEQEQRGCAGNKMKGNLRKVVKV